MICDCRNEWTNMNIIEISDLATRQLDVYARLSERQLATLYEPEPGLFIAESPKVIRRALNGGYCPVSFLVEKRELETLQEVKQILEDVETLSKEKSPGGEKREEVVVYTASEDILSRLTGFHLTRGMLCVMKRKKLPALEDILKGARRIAILEEVVNPTNVGAIFRSAAALGMDGVIVTGGCADPLYRRAARVSMGTVFQVPWTMLEKKDGIWPEQTMAKLHEAGFKTAAMALKQESVCLDDETLAAEEKLALVLGTEGDGLKDSTIADCDYTVLIPMTHDVDSLNVAAASAVAFWQLGRKK